MRYLITKVLLCIAISGCGDVEKAELLSTLNRVDTALDDDTLHGQSLFHVNVFYVVPASGHYSDEKEYQIRNALTTAQSFFSREMERHGYGARTFEIERNPNGEIAIHRHMLKRPAGDYYADLQLLGNEIREWEGSLPQHRELANGDPSDIHWRGHHAYWNGMPSVFFVDLPGYHGRCGSGGGGDAWMYCWDWQTLAHELGHVMGLQHDFRSNSYMMSYGSHFTSISVPAAAWINYHRDITFPIHRRYQSGGIARLVDTKSLKVDLSFLKIYVDTYNDYVLSEQTLDFDYAIVWYGSPSRGNLVGGTHALHLKEIEDIPLSPDRSRYKEVAVYELSLDGVPFPDPPEEVNIYVIGKFGYQSNGHVTIDMLVE